MKHWIVTRLSDGEIVYRYQAEAAIEWQGFEFITHAHTEDVQAGAPAEPELPESAWCLHTGPFKDRLGMDAHALAASTHPVCVAAREALADRVYVSLKNPKTVALLDMLIATAQPAASPYFPGSGPMTAEKKAAILGVPATEAERYKGAL